MSMRQSGAFHALQRFVGNESFLYEKETNRPVVGRKARETRKSWKISLIRYRDIGVQRYDGQGFRTVFPISFSPDIRSEI